MTDYKNASSSLAVRCGAHLPERSTGQHSLETIFLAGVLMLKTYYGHPDYTESEDALDFFDKVTGLAALVGMLDPEKPSPKTLGYIMRARRQRRNG